MLSYFQLTPENTVGSRYVESAVLLDQGRRYSSHQTQTFQALIMVSGENQQKNSKENASYSKPEIKVFYQN